MEWKTTRFVTALCSLVAVTQSTYAQDYQVPKTAQVSRYAYVDMESSKNTRNIMVSVIDESFGSEVKTVGEAVQQLVHKYGYAIGHQHNIDRSQYYLLNLPLPETHREFSPFPLISTLALLGGEGFAVEVNPVRREVSYRLVDKYKGSLTRQEVDSAASTWFSQHPISGHHISQTSPSCDDKEGFTYGPVLPGETLLTIARSLNKSKLTIAQVMISIYIHNPKSFLHENINYLLQGAQLNIPSDLVMSEMPKAHAHQLMMEHYARWKEGRAKD